MSRRRWAQVANDAAAAVLNAAALVAPGAAHDQGRVSNATLAILRGSNDALG